MTPRGPSGRSTSGRHGADGAGGAAAGYRVALTVPGAGLSAVGVVLAVVGLRVSSLGLAAVGVLCLAMLGASFLLRPSMGWGLALDGPLRCIEHQPADHLGTLTFTGRATGPPARISVRLDGFASVTFTAPPMRPGDNRQVELVLRPQRRGRSRWLEVTSTTDAPFGLLRRTVTVRTPSDGIVHPALRQVTALPAGGGAGDRLGGAPDRRGVPFHGVRELRPGDNARDVHWRSTAKRGRPVVLERERPEGDDVLVVLAGPSAAPGTDRAWERLVGTAAWSVAAAVRDGRRPRLVVLDPARPAGTSGEVPAHDPVTVLDTFALLDAVGVLQRADVASLAEVCAPGTPVVVFAPRDAVAAARAWVGAAFAATGRPATVVTS